MCELHHAALKPSQDVQGTSQAAFPALRKKFHLGETPTDDPPFMSIFLPRDREMPQKSPATLRKKLWELDRYYHCSIIGTCLTLAELRHIRRRLQGIVHASDTDYDLHRAFVAVAQDPTPATRLIHKFLDRKYKTAVQQLTKVQSAEEFSAYWDAAIAAGDIAGAYWALITQPETPRSVLDHVYGEVHMLSHLSGASIRVDLQELHRLKRRCPELEAQLAEAQATMRRRLAKQQDIIGALNKRLVETLETERKLQAAEARWATFEEETQIARIKAEIADMRSQLVAERERSERSESVAHLWRQQASRTIDHNEWLARQLADMRHERDRLEATLERLLESSDADADVDGVDERFASNGGPDLVGRCVLYVGGRQSQCAHFRELVERCNGRFIHHDGGREDARAQLWDVVQQADTVMCPLDCISHDAMHRVKRFCERTTKPLVLLPRASLAAFNRGLSTVAVPRSPSC